MSDHKSAAHYKTVEYPRHVHACADTKAEADRLIRDGGVVDDETARAFPKTFHKHLASADDAPAALSAGWYLDVERPSECDPTDDAPAADARTKAKK
jgi:hypothetical protein